MKSISIKVIGIKSFVSKKGDAFKILFYTSPPYEQGVVGGQCGSFFIDPNSHIELSKEYKAILGYDRAGKFGVVDILNDKEV